MADSIDMLSRLVLNDALLSANKRALALEPGAETDAVVGKLLGRDGPYSTDAGAMWAAVEWAALQMDVEAWDKDRYVALQWSGPEYKSIGNYMTEHDMPAGMSAWWCGVSTYWHSRLVFSDARPMVSVCRAVAYIGWVHVAVAEAKASSVRGVDLYPNRLEACRIANDGGIDTRVVHALEQMTVQEVRALLRQHRKDGDQSVLWWLSYIESQRLATVARR